VYYVVATDTRKNSVTVSQNRLDAACKEVTLERVHWIGDTILPLEAAAQTRYRETPAKVRVEGRGTEARILFEEPHIASTGQSLVLYENDRVLGGGTISR
jgi:tRNA-specific 2-thiouridylase